MELNREQEEIKAETERLFEQWEELENSGSL